MNTTRPTILLVMAAVILSRYEAFWSGDVDIWNVHFVAVAIGGLTPADAGIRTYFPEMSQPDIWKYYDRVNDLGETGTFYPRFPVTVVPLTRWENRVVSGNPRDFLERCFRDVIKANDDYIKVKTILVHLGSATGYGYPEALAINVASSVFSDSFSADTVYLHPVS